MTTIGSSNKEENGIGIIDWDRRIYRFYRKKHFTDLVQKGKNCLVSPSKWGDPFENFFLTSKYIDRNGEAISLEPLRKDWFGQCWTTHKNSGRMWCHYSPESEAVRVSTTIRKLFDGFYDTSDQYAALKYFVGTVTYMREENIRAYFKNTSIEDIVVGANSLGMAATLYIKEERYSWESEVRLLFYDVEGTATGRDGHAFFDFNYTDVFDEIALDSRLAPHEFEEMRSELRASGCTLPIIQSGPYNVAQAQL
jgi:hypothetical protein